MLGLGLIEGVSGLLKSGLDLFTGDDKRKAEIYLEELKVAAQRDIAQAEINKAEAAHRSPFVAGWRPAMGWIGVTSVAFMYIVDPFVFPFMYDSFPQLQNIKGPDGNIMEIMLGMLGLGSLRSYEKLKGVTK